MKFLYNSKVLAIVFIIIVSFPAVKNLNQKGFYTSHDGETHTARIAQYYKALTDKQLPPRFAPTLYNGLGSPIFVYIYPTPYLIGSTIHALNFSYSSSFKIVMALSFIFSGIFTYLWLRTFFDSEKSGLLGAMFYIWAPYRLSLIYVRGSISEILAYTFLPLSFYSFTKLSQKTNPKWTAISAISLSLVFLSQNLVAIISTPVLMVYILITGISKKSVKYLIFSFISGLWAFAISSVTYLPSLFERNFIRIDEIIRVAYPDHFVTLKQLIYSPWGYGFDLPGTKSDQLSFQIGLAHILILISSILLPTVYFLTKRLKITNLLLEKQKGKSLAFTLYFLLIVALCIFLMTKTDASLYIWQNVKQLHIIDIPWRLLGIVVLSVAFLAGFVAKTIKPSILTVLFIAAVLIANRNHTRINQAVFFDDNHFQNYTQTATQYNEFTPKWRQTTRVPIGFELGETVETVSGEVKIEILQNKSNKINFTAEVKSPNAKVRINKFYFPGWEVKINGRKQKPFENIKVTDAQNSELDKQKDASGLMQLNLEKGRYNVTAEFKETPLRKVADILSLIAIISVLGVLIKNVKA